MTKLPFPPRKILLSTFWWGLALAVGVLAGFGTLLATASPFLTLLILGGIAGTAWIGVRIQGVALGAFRGWNRIVEMVGYVASRATLTVLYCILALTALGGSRMQLSPPATDDSLWDPFGERGVPGTDGRRGDLEKENEEDLAGWVRRADNAWVMPLIPFFRIVATFHSRTRSMDPPTNIYTLY